MKRKPRVKRPRPEKVQGYDSMWEYLLHDTLLKDWEHHTEKVAYTVKHFYEPDFTRTLQGKQILLEYKGRFWDYLEYSKNKWVRDNLPEDVELVFLFANPAAPMPGAKVRKDGTTRTHGEWATANKFRWFAENTLPDSWIDINAKTAEEFLDRQQAADNEESDYGY